MRDKGEDRNSRQQILHLTHLSMANRCGSRAPRLDTALMDSPLVLTQERRRPGPQKKSWNKRWRQQDNQGSVGATLHAARREPRMIRR